MSWDEDRFDRFVDATISMARGELPGYGYCHVLLPYAPSDEVHCIGQVRLVLGARLSQAGFDSNVFAVAPLVAQVVSRYAKRELADADDFRLLESTLATTLTSATAELLARDIRKLSAETVVVLCRLGALYPFGHVSSLLQALQGFGVRNTVAVAYPGGAWGGLQLRFLGRNEATGGYRGHIVT